MDAHSADSIAAAWSDGRPTHIVEKIVAVELELDQVWPGWRTKRPFDKVTIDLKQRIKWLLKRHSLLTRTEDGQPSPLEWDVLVVKDGRNPNKCYAHPVIPKVQEGGSVTREPPSTLPQSALEALHAASRPPADSKQAIAGELGIAVDAVDRALQAKPVGWMDTDAAWVRRFRAPPPPVAPVTRKNKKQSLSKES